MCPEAGILTLIAPSPPPPPPAVKPRPPWNVTLSWTEADALAVSCPAHPYRGLDYEVQHRDAFDPEWQASDGAWGWGGASPSPSSCHSPAHA